MTLIHWPEADLAFGEAYPVAWAFHSDTSRWPFNLLEPPDTPYAKTCFKEYPQARVIELPPPQSIELTLGAAIARRLSCRRFSERPVALGHLGTMLHLAYGVQGRVSLGSLEHLERPVPSGGGLYPLELYVVARRIVDLEPGLYHYAPLSHLLEQLRTGAFPDGLLSQLFLGQPYVAAAAAIVILTGVIDRSMHKYTDRGYRYILLEAGHVGQNLNLVSPALDLGSFNLGGFFDQALARLLDVESEQEIPLYAVAIGQPESADRSAARIAEGVL